MIILNYEASLVGEPGQYTVRLVYEARVQYKGNI